MKLEGQNVPGEIIEIQGNNALVAFGNLKTSVKLSRLSRISKSAYKRETRQSMTLISSELSDRIRTKKLNFKPDIDVRGMRGDEALQAVTNHIDEALICENASLRFCMARAMYFAQKWIRQLLGTILL